MTEEILEKGKELIRKIDYIDMVLSPLGSYCKVDSQKEKFKPCLRIRNRREIGTDKLQAACILFNGIDTHGIDIPVDKDFVNFLYDYFTKKKAELLAEFKDLS